MTKAVARLLLCSLLVATRGFAEPDNPNIDMDGYLQTAREAAEHLRAHRVSEEEFIRLSRELGTVILDTSNRETYRQLHVADAVNLPCPEIDGRALARILPGPDTRVLLYENNNYQALVKQRAAGGPKNELGVPLAGDWSGDAERACRILREYGYRNLYALAPYVRVDRSSLPTVAGMAAVDLAEPIDLSLNRGAR